MKPLLKSLLSLFIFCCLIIRADAQANYLKITSYNTYFGWARHYPQDWMIIRKFMNDGKTYFVLVNPQTLETKIDEAGFYEIKHMTQDETKAFFKNTPYLKAINKAESQSVATQDAGV